MRLLAIVSGLASAALTPHPLDLARCADAAERQLIAWSTAFDRPSPDPDGPSGVRSTRFPTSTLGVWTRASVDVRGAVLLERVSPDRVESVSYDEACHAVTSRQPRSAAGGFSDAALAARLARGDTGVILLWSPHMPLSVDQHAVLQPLAAELGIAVVAVLDPAADPAYARTVARERRLSANVLQPLTAIELAFRGMTTHAPSLQLFSDGRLIGPVLFGYRHAAAARLAITAVLAR